MMAAEAPNRAGRLGVGVGSGWLTRQEAAAYCGISVGHLDRLVSLGRISKCQPYPRASVRIARSECDRYLQIRSN